MDPTKDNTTTAPEGSDTALDAAGVNSDTGTDDATDTNTDTQEHDDTENNAAGEDDSDSGDADESEDADDTDGFFTFADLDDEDEPGDPDADGDTDEGTDDEQAETSDEEETGTEDSDQETDTAENSHGQEETDGVSAENTDGATDFAAWEAEDIAGISEANPELADAIKGKKLNSIVANPRRFAELRGDPILRGKISAAEAFKLAGGLAGGKAGTIDTPAKNGAPEKPAGVVRNNANTGKSHLRPGPSKPAQPSVTVPSSIKRMRDRGDFGSDVSDAELLSLFRSVT